MKKITLFLFLVAFSSCFSQDGSLDFSFNPTGLPSGYEVVCVAAQPNGDLLVGGSKPNLYPPLSRLGYVLRLKANGTLDASFTEINFRNGLNGHASVSSLYIQDNGYIVIGGDFSDSRSGRSNIVRVNQNGIIDTSFNHQIPPLSFTPFAIKKQPVTGKLIAVGPGTKNVYRLLSNGNIDATFNSSQSANHTVYDVDFFSNGDIIIGGAFTTYNNQSRSKIAKLYANGDLHPTFHSSNLNGGDIAYGVCVLNDNSVIVGGALNHLTSPQHKRLIKYNANGTLNNSFYPNINGWIVSLLKENNNEIIIVGNFTNISGSTRNGIARLYTSNGTVDSCFNPMDGFESSPYAVSLQPSSLAPNGNVFVGGGFNSYNNIPRSRLVKIIANTDVDIVAVNDTGNPVNGVAGGIAVANVLTNDTYNGAAATTANVSLTQMSTTNPGITLNTSTGAVSVASGTPAGSYTLTYKACMLNTQCFCGTATVTVNVITSTVKPLKDYYIVPIGTTTVSNIRSNDTFNGNPATVLNTTVSQIQPHQPGFIVNNNGSVSIASWVGPGNYIIEYQLCENNTNNCDNDIIMIVIEAEIDAINDNIFTDSSIASSHNILDNDFYNNSPAGISDDFYNPVYVSLVGSLPNGFELITDNLINMGMLNILPSVAPGTYSFTYQICDIYAGTTCDTAVVTIMVESYEMKDSTRTNGDVTDSSLQTKYVTIYPNPSTDIFNIDLSGYNNDQFEITVYNALGQLIHQSKVVTDNRYTLDLSQHQTGNYFITLQNNNETINKIITKK